MALYDTEREKGIDNRSKKKPIAQNKNKRSEPSTFKSNTNARQGLRSSNTGNTSGSVVPLSAGRTDSNFPMPSVLPRKTYDNVMDTAKEVGSVARQALKPSINKYAGLAADYAVSKSKGSIPGVRVANVSTQNTNTSGMVRAPAMKDPTAVYDVGTNKKDTDKLLSERANRNLSGFNDPSGRYSQVGTVAGFNQIRDTKTGKDNIYTNLSGDRFASEFNKMESGTGYGIGSRGATTYAGPKGNETITSAIPTEQEDAENRRWLDERAKEKVYRDNLKYDDYLWAQDRHNRKLEQIDREGQVLQEQKRIESAAKRQQAQQEQQQKLLDEARKNFSSTSIKLMTDEEIDDNGMILGESINVDKLNDADRYRRINPNLSETQAVSISLEHNEMLERVKAGEVETAPPREALNYLLSNPTEENVKSFYRDYGWLPSALR